MKFKLITVFLATVLFLIGCQGNTTKNIEEGMGVQNNTFEKTRTNDNVDNRNTRVNDDRNSTIRNISNNRDNNRDSNNRQDKFDVSEEAANRIVDEVKEINQAYVIKSKRNAYVAAVLDEDNNYTKTADDNRSTRMNTRNVNDRHAKTRTNNKGNSNDRKSDNHMINNPGMNTDDLTDKVKKQVADIVQSVDSNIENVYVTTSPDFVDLSNNYINDMNDGKPIRGFFDQIGNMVERIFPQNK